MQEQTSGNPYHTQIVGGELVVGTWDHRPVMEHFESIEISQGETLLDAGCRDGMFSAYFSKRGAIVTAIDIADTETRKKVQQESGFEFIMMNILELPECDRKWDVVFCSDVLCHMRDPLGGLLAIRSMCRSRAYFVTDAWEHLGEACIVNDHSRACKNVFYPFSWSPVFFHKMLEWAGFNDVEIVSKMTLCGTEYADRTVYLFSCRLGQERGLDISDILEWKKYKMEQGI